MSVHRHATGDSSEQERRRVIKVQSKLPTYPLPRANRGENDAPLLSKKNSARASARDPLTSDSSNTVVNAKSHLERERERERETRKKESNSTR